MARDRPLCEQGSMMQRISVLAVKATVALAGVAVLVGLGVILLQVARGLAA